jgi:hypothetical protein
MCVRLLEMHHFVSEPHVVTKKEKRIGADKDAYELIACVRCMITPQKQRGHQCSSSTPGDLDERNHVVLREEHDTYTGSSSRIHA